MYDGKMLASVYRSNWIYGEWLGPDWQHEHCTCRLIVTKTGEKFMRGGHRERYFSGKGRSRKSRQQQRQLERRRENRAVYRHILDETS